MIDRLMNWTYEHEEHVTFLGVLLLVVAGAALLVLALTVFVLAFLEVIS